jgi:hypothetical protein
MRQKLRCKKGVRCIRKRVCTKGRISEEQNKNRVLTAWAIVDLFQEAKWSIIPFYFIKHHPRNLKSIIHSSMASFTQNRTINSLCCSPGWSTSWESDNIDAIVAACIVINRTMQSVTQRHGDITRFSYWWLMICCRYPIIYKKKIDVIDEIANHCSDAASLSLVIHIEIARPFSIRFWYNSVFDINLLYLYKGLIKNPLHFNAHKSSEFS